MKRLGLFLGMLVAFVLGADWRPSQAADSAPARPMYQAMSDSIPTVGQETEAFLGDRMLLQRTGEYRDCIVPNFTHEEKKFGWMISIIANKPICKTSSGDRDYLPNYVNGRSSSAENVYRVNLKREASGGLTICLTEMGLNAMCVKGKADSDFKVGPWFLSADNSFQQTIEYSGKSGSVLKFTYSESADGMARASFNRDFQIDLAEGPALAYKGAIIEVLSATNTSIKYKVVRNFQ